MNMMVNQNAQAFFENVASIIENARRFVGRTADLTMCVTYYEVGRMIVEEEQGGEARAKYGTRLLAELSQFLNDKFKSGFSETTLKYARKFYRIYAPSIRQAMNDKLKNTKGQAMLDEFTSKWKNKELHILPVELYPFKLSWSHYLILMRIENERERSFYEKEAFNENWTYRHLQREYSSSLYERLALSRNSEEIARLSNEGQVVEKPQDILKNPLVLEYLGLNESADYSETELESAIISKLQQFLLELGKGFLFEARQKRFTFQEKHFKVDLVTYNRLLKCYVVIDFKKDELTHQDLGQMQMYVHYYDRHVKTDDENPTVGILICGKKDDAIVELTLPEGENIYASEYSLYLPDKNLLQSKLAQWIEEFEEAQTILEIAEDGDAE